MWSLTHVPIRILRRLCIVPPLPRGVSFNIPDKSLEPTRLFETNTLINSIALQFNCCIATSIEQWREQQRQPRWHQRQREQKWHHCQRRSDWTEQAQ